MCMDMKNKHKMGFRLGSVAQASTQFKVGFSTEFLLKFGLGTSASIEVWAMLLIVSSDSVLHLYPPNMICFRSPGVACYIYGIIFTKVNGRFYCILMYLSAVSYRIHFIDFKYCNFSFSMLDAWFLQVGWKG